MVSSISDSQPHYSVGLLYHRAGLAVQSFLLLYVEKYHIILLRLIALHSVCGCSSGCAFGFQHFHHLVGGGGGRALLEVAGNHKDGVSHAYLGHAVRAADGVIKSVSYCIYSLNTNLNPDSFARLDFHKSKTGIART